MHRFIFTAIGLLGMVPSSSSGAEAFIAQLSSSSTGGSVQSLPQNAVAVTRLGLGSSAAKIAAPLNINALRASSLASAGPNSNLSLIMQAGTNNFASLAQIGGSNTSTIVQNGTNNHAVLNQRH
jgi:hypothetical protein